MPVIHFIVQANQAPGLRSTFPDRVAESTALETQSRTIDVGSTRIPDVAVVPTFKTLGGSHPKSADCNGGPPNNHPASLRQIVGDHRRTVNPDCPSSVRESSENADLYLRYRTFAA